MDKITMFHTERISTLGRFASVLLGLVLGLSALVGAAHAQDSISASGPPKGLATSAGLNSLGLAYDSYYVLERRFATMDSLLTYSESLNLRLSKIFDSSRDACFIRDTLFACYSGERPEDWHSVLVGLTSSKSLSEFYDELSSLANASVTSNSLVVGYFLPSDGICFPKILLRIELGQIIVPLASLEDCRLACSKSMGWSAAFYSIITAQESAALRNVPSVSLWGRNLCFWWEHEDNVYWGFVYVEGLSQLMSSLAILNYMSQHESDGGFRDVFESFNVPYGLARTRKLGPLLEFSQDRSVSP